MYLTHALRAISRGIAVVTDPFFKYVSMLLTGNSTSVTYTTDISTNKLAVTVYTGASVSNLTPFAGRENGSVLLNGTSGYLSIPNNAVLNLASGNFTVEAWVYYQGTNIAGTIIDKDGVFNSTLSSYCFGLKNSKLNMFLGSGNGVTYAQDITAPANLPTNQWVHVAVVKSGTTITLYQNGTSVASATQTGTIIDGGKPVLIGWQQSQPNSQLWKGYISNLRVVKGTAVYTSNFTPSATPLTAITNTSLLTLQSNLTIVNNNTFFDDSTNNFAVTRVGNTTQGTFTPYGPNWSNYFDGSGDYLTVPSNAAFNLGTTFTIEFWFYRTIDQSMRIVSRQDGSPPYNGYNISYGEVAGQWYFDASASSITFADGGLSNIWVHYAWVVNGTSGKVYRNGVQVGSTATQTAQTPSTNTTLLIGAREGPTNYVGGYISNLRIVKGTAVYTAAFTPPTAPLTAIANTSLLTCADNRFIDDSTNNFTITKNGDVSVQRFSPFNPSAAYSSSVISGSAYFDGTGDYLVTTTNSALTLSGNYTVEAWVYVPSGGINTALRFLQNSPGTVPTGYWYLYVTNTNFQMYNVDITSTVLVNVGAFIKDSWVHFAASRSGATTRIFVNGTQTYSYAGSTSFTNNGWHVGGGPDVEYFKGYIANHRVITGTAVYTAAFTPPTAPVTAITNTSLLLDFTNAGIIDNAMMNDLETVGNAQISTAQSKFGSGAMFFAGGTDYLTVPSNVNLEFGSGDFTIEAWVYFNSRVANSAIISKGNNGTYLIYMGAGNELAFYASTNGSSWTTSNLTISSSPSLSTWHHIAIVRSGNTVSTYFNGTFVQNAAMTGSLISQPSVPLLVGRYIESMNGYIDDLRFTKGYARYTANFTPPTAALPTS
jgi:hypothetical protein